jgi:hypothetical protein
MSPPPHLGHPTRNSSSMQQINNSQHKRSLSFNHHLTYNQVQAQQQQQQQQQQLMHQPQQPQAFMKPNSTPQHQLLSQRKEIVPTSPSIKSAQMKSKSYYELYESDVTL